MTKQTAMRIDDLPAPGRRINYYIWSGYFDLDQAALGYVEAPYFERELIRAGEGRKRAMAKGVKFGRPRKLNPH